MNEQQTTEQQVNDLYEALKIVHVLYKKYGRDGAVKVYQLTVGGTVEGANKMMDLSIALYGS